MDKHFTIKKSEEDYLEFEVKNINISLANAIRRIVLSEVETIAVNDKDVNILENTCPLHNEYISHRISLIPIHQNFKLDIDNLSDLEFYIAKKNTKNVPIENEQLSILEITTNNIQIFNKKTDSWVSPNIIFDGEYLITKLNLKQKFLASFKLSSGTASQHSRWQCVNTIAYRYKVKADLKPNQEYDKINLEEERDWIKKKGSEEPEAFLFYLESIGKISPMKIIQKSLEILKEKCLKFNQYIKENKEELSWLKNGILELEYEGETHTLGNLISTIGLEMLGEDDFIGYRIIHPMLNKFILRLKIAENDNKEEHIKILMNLVDRIINHIEGLTNEWKSI